ncbi:M20 family metallopeptidase [bacterium]|jgi:acetylornithine deacetylase/succinyl-diaminopimelate desuccinylase family protein|nr:M20 family metallopeptidase [Verrucomicrobiota bacterium]MDA7510070.1 M20 family metallopeptidase [Verrucomicrobiota bacterium]MDA7633468.1 M20 family metallopeptidase [bacterium]MDA7657626.1 M20 family metallopeptidase [Verrucomicrobiota bacterium]
MTNVRDTLAELVRINSVNPEWGGPGESGVARWIRHFFERAAIEVWEEECLPGRNNVMARLPGADPNRRVLLEAHMDTVSASNMGFAPFDPVIDKGRMRGRGSCDVKAGLAAMVHAIYALKKHGHVPPCEIIFAAVVDEEHAYRGVLRLIESLQDSTLPEAAVVAEPTELRLVRANKGVLRWKIVTYGKSVHSAHPKRGHNAISDMAKVILALEDHFADLEKTTHPLLGAGSGSIGLIEGGEQINIVPSRCEIKVDRRLLPGESATDALAQCEATLAQLRAQHPQLDVGMEAPSLTDEAMETPAHSAVVESASRVLRSLGFDGEPLGVSFGCDCTKLSRAGIPSIIFGPGSIAQAHTNDEFIELKQVQTALEFYQQFLLDYGRT